MSRLLVLLSLFFGVALHAQEPLSAEAIMARVAANQDTSQADRQHYVYMQHARVLSRKGKTTMCEEVTESLLTPNATGTSQRVLKLDGKLWRKHAYITYTEKDSKDSKKLEKDTDDEKKGLRESIDDDSDMDRDLVENMRDHLTRDRSKDGIGAGLFPLTSTNQAEYLFHLVGTEERDGRSVYHVTFRPKDKDSYGWKGDAYIDTIAFQPVLVQTAMVRKLPFAIRTLMGTSLPGLGFVVSYAPQPDGLWFPVTFGTEFKLHVLFFLNRDIVISARNHDFEKTHVSSRLIDPADAPKP